MRKRRQKTQPVAATISIFDHFKTSHEFLGFIVGIITSITFILAQISTPGLNKNDVLFGVEIINICVLLIALGYIKFVPLKIYPYEYAKLDKYIITDITIENAKSRVNALIKQLVHAIKWFAIMLLIFYIVHLYNDYFLVSYDELKDTLEDQHCFLTIPGHNLDVQKFLVLELVTNSLNLFSAAFLFIAFQVLFTITVDDDDKTSTLKLISIPPVSIAIIITIANIICVMAGINEANLSEISHVFRLIGGIYNGVAMLLLFSRFISMEFLFQNSKKNWQRNFYLYGSVIALPLYVVAQPLYGLFNAVNIEWDGWNILFKTILFLIGFWGKLVFLLFIYTMLKNKWIHGYIFMVLVQKPTLSNLSKDLEDVDDL